MATRQQLKDELKKQLKEMSTSGAAGAYNTRFAFNPNKNAQGTARNYYLKMGYELVNKEKVRRAAKGMVYKDLWK